MGGSLGQRLRRGDLRVLRLLGGGFPAVVPQPQHGAHHDVHLPAGGVVHLPGIEQEFNQRGRDLQRVPAGVPIYGGQVGDAAVFVIDVEELVICLQYLGRCLAVGLEDLLAVPGVAVNVGYRVKKGEICHALRFCLN